MIDGKTCVLVEWVDPWSISGWTDRDQALREVEDHDDRCWNIGWIVAETSAYLALASAVTAAKSPQLGDVFKLPYCVIRRVTDVATGRQYRLKHRPA